MNNILAENLYGHGGVKDTPDSRDYQYSQIAGSSLPFDWSVGFDIETVVGKLPVKNQYQSYSCGGQAWASYSYVLDPSSREEKSAKFIYAQTHIGTGGSDGRSNCQICTKKGVSSEKLCPSYMNDGTVTEPFMTTNDISAFAFADALTNEEKSYLSVNTDIDTVAQAIRDSGGVVIGITGKNNGTWRTKFVIQPDVSDSSCWNHWVYAGKALMINGVKYIGFLNSWGTEVGENGWQYISEDYFKSGFIWSCWTMMYNKDIPFTFTKTLKLGSTGLDVKMLQTKLGITSDGIFGKNTQSAVVAFQIRHQLRPDGIVGHFTNIVLNL